MWRAFLLPQSFWGSPDHDDDDEVDDDNDDDDDDDDDDDELSCFDRPLGACCSQVYAFPLSANGGDEQLHPHNRQGHVAKGSLPCMTGQAATASKKTTRFTHQICRACNIRHAQNQLSEIPHTLAHMHD